MSRRKRGDGKSALSMKSIDLESYWSWLPTFRVVAERENVQEASRLLRLSASSISRTIRLLEQELQQELFSRHGGRLRLTTEGRSFLEAVRRSMRLVDDGAAALTKREDTPFRLTLPAGLAALLAVPAISRMRNAQPLGRFHVNEGGDTKMLAAGVTDLLVVCGAPETTDDLEVHRLGDLALGIYCGPAHPLWDRHSPATFEQLVEHAFIATRWLGGWPPEHPREIALDLGDASGAVDACVASLGLAILPAAVATAALARRELRMVQGPSLLPPRLYAVRRPLLQHDRAAEVIQALRESLAGDVVHPSKDSKDGEVLVEDAGR